MRSNIKEFEQDLAEFDRELNTINFNELCVFVEHRIRCNVESGLFVTIEHSKSWMMN